MKVEERNEVRKELNKGKKIIQEIEFKLKENGNEEEIKQLAKRRRERF